MSQNAAPSAHGAASAGGAAPSLDDMQRGALSFCISAAAYEHFKHTGLESALLDGGEGSNEMVEAFLKDVLSK